MKQIKGSRLLVMAMAGTIAGSGLCTAAHAAPLRSATPAAVSASVVSPVQAIKDDLNQQLLGALQDDVARRAFVDAMIQRGQGVCGNRLAGAQELMVRLRGRAIGQISLCVKCRIQSTLPYRNLKWVSGSWGLGAGRMAR